MVKIYWKEGTCALCERWRVVSPQNIHDDAGNEVIEELCVDCMMAVVYDLVYSGEPDA